MPSEIPWQGDDKLLFFESLVGRRINKSCFFFLLADQDVLLMPVIIDRTPTNKYTGVFYANITNIMVLECRT
jgi:hypothetical protein